MADQETAAILAALSELLLSLHQASESVPLAEFQREALRLLKEKIPFDCANWATGIAGANQKPVIFSIHFYHYKLPESDWWAAYEPIKHRDFALMRAMARPGTTINLASEDIADLLDSDPEQKNFVEKLELRHTLMTLTRGPIDELASAITVCRTDADRPFSETERLLMQNAVPHLAALWDQNRMRQLEGALLAGQQHWRPAAALADGKGMLYNANAGFVAMMHREWPDWRGPKLPEPLLKAIRSRQATPALFSRIALHTHAINDLHLLHLRQIVSADGLSEREREVAQAFGQGLSHKEIARQMGLSPNTVRNHLSAIYDKMDVSNKAELIACLQQAFS